MNAKQVETLAARIETLAAFRDEQTALAESRMANADAAQDDNRDELAAELAADAEKAQEAADDADKKVTELTAELTAARAALSKEPADDDDDEQPAQPALPSVKEQQRLSKLRDKVIDSVYRMEGGATTARIRVASAVRKLLDARTDATVNPDGTVGSEKRRKEAVEQEVNIVLVGKLVEATGQTWQGSEIWRLLNTAGAIGCMARPEDLEKMSGTQRGFYLPWETLEGFAPLTVRGWDENGRVSWSIRASVKEQATALFQRAGTGGPGGKVMRTVDVRASVAILKAEAETIEANDRVKAAVDKAAAVEDRAGQLDEESALAAKLAEELTEKANAETDATVKAELLAQAEKANAEAEEKAEAMRVADLELEALEANRVALKKAASEKAAALLALKTETEVVKPETKKTGPKGPPVMKSEEFDARLVALGKNGQPEAIAEAVEMILSEAENPPAALVAMFKRLNWEAPGMLQALVIGIGQTFSGMQLSNFNRLYAGAFYSPDVAASAPRTINRFNMPGFKIGGTTLTTLPEEQPAEQVA